MPINLEVCGEFSSKTVGRPVFALRSKKLEQGYLRTLLFHLIVHISCWCACTASFA